MSIEGVGATFNWGGVIAGIKNITIPDDEVNEYNSTTLDSTRESFKMSALSIGQEVTLTVELDPTSPVFTARDAQAGAVITLSKQASGSTTAATYTFDGFTRVVTGGNLDVGSTDSVTQDVTIRLTSEIVFVAES